MPDIYIFPPTLQRSRLQVNIFIFIVGFGKISDFAGYLAG